MTSPGGETIQGRHYPRGDTIQGGILFKGGHQLRKYGILFRRFLHCAEDERWLHNAAVASDYWVTVFEVKWRILFDVRQPKE